MFRIILLLGGLGCAVKFARAIQYTKTISTTGGSIRGEEVDLGEIKFKAFRGIPYAAPPEGELRFMAPQPAEIWKDVKDTVKYGHICHQESKAKGAIADIIAQIKSFILNFRYLNFLELLLRPPVQASEDCLTLNVYTTQLGEDGLKPVLFWIHGGAFLTGDGTDKVYGPEYLINDGIVIVTINYRLGPLGFLSTNTSDAPGNWGLKDQAAALKWVNKNIENFGGDPNQVTIYGESAGGASVHYHLLSPLSRGLFHRVIASSGSANCDWSYNDQQDLTSRRLAELVGASQNEIDEPAERIRFLRKVQASALLTQSYDVLQESEYLANAIPYLPFSPVVEPVGTEHAFLTENPRKLLAEGKFAKVPLMMGFNDMEGSLLFGTSTFKEAEDLRGFNPDVCTTLIPKVIREKVQARNSCSEVNQQVLDIYFDGKPIGESDPLRYLNLYGDYAIRRPIYEAQTWHAHYAGKNTPVYLYYFVYDGEWNMAKKLMGIDLPGAAHADELFYVFKARSLRTPKLLPNSPGYNTHKRMLSFIDNFVKYGNPTPNVTDLVPIKWEPAVENEMNTMVIGADLKLEKKILEDRMALYVKLMED